MRRRSFLATTLAAFAQEPGEKPLEFLCPMDPDVRSKAPGKCPRCGMKLIAGILDQIEFRVEVSTAPRKLASGKTATFTFEVFDPRTNKPVRDFEVMHEKLFHLFAISEDLQFFAHEHPVKGFDSKFDLDLTLPRSGMYRLLCDYYPLNALPQLTAKTLYVAGKIAKPVPLMADLAPQRMENMTAAIRLEPADPIAGMKTQLYFALDETAGLEPFLGAWGHMLAASEDLVDMIHTHPFLADGKPNLQFNLIFPRAGMHRVWVQFQRKGVVNTAAFNVAVRTL